LVASYRPQSREAATAILALLPPLRGFRSFRTHDLRADARSYVLSSLRDYKNLGENKLARVRDQKSFDFCYATKQIGGGVKTPFILE
jgi:hypothetical protein